HLRVAEIADETLTQRRPRRTREPLGRRVSPAAKRAQQRLRAEVDEVGGAGQLEGDERRLRRAEQRRDPGGGCKRPARLSAGDAERGERTGAPPAEQRVANRESRVLSRRDDHDERDPEE